MVSGLRLKHSMVFKFFGSFYLKNKILLRCFGLNVVEEFVYLTKKLPIYEPDQKVDVRQLKFCVDYFIYNISVPNKIPFFTSELATIYCLLLLSSKRNRHSEIKFV